jgi:hypothetical protein
MPGDEAGKSEIVAGFASALIGQRAQATRMAANRSSAPVVREHVRSVHTSFAWSCEAGRCLRVAVSCVRGDANDACVNPVARVHSEMTMVEPIQANGSRVCRAIASVADNRKRCRFCLTDVVAVQDINRPVI